MSEFLEMRSSKKKRTGLNTKRMVEKLTRDAENMYEHARYVIVLNEEGEVIEKINHFYGFVGNYLVVLAPLTYKKEHIPMSVVLEIGLGRLTPYKQFIKTFCYGDVEIRIADRTPIVKMKDSLVIKLLPLIAKTLQSIVDQDISHRETLTIVKNKGDSVRDAIIQSRGIFIRINKEEEILSYVCLARDIETRSNHHLNRFVKNVITKLAVLFGKSDYYTDKELKKQSIGGRIPADDIAFFVFEANFPTHIMKIVREKIIKLDNQTNSYIELFDQILRVFKIKTLDTDVDDQMLYVELDKKFGDRKKELLSKFPILIGVDVKRTSTRKEWRIAENKDPLWEHAKGCIVVEVKPSRELLLARGELKKHEFHT